uniref:Copia protein n=1 Tax=Tanacetum cinerariifolium TaxID=118510 RepID=A0A6L2LB70_TANCI|nr:copia protein [Tanacetum cinerariifolium]
MQEELNQFVANDIWELVPQPKNMTIIGTKWVFRNKLEENGIVSRNKARLVAQGYNQQEGIDYDETYASVARLESIRILLAYACALDFKLFQIDVKSAFLNGFTNEEYRLSYFDEGQTFVEFVIQNQYFSFPLEDFDQILRIHCEGACVFSDRWSLDELVYGAPSEGPYQTNLPSSDDIILFIREDRDGQVTCIRYQEEVKVQDYQILNCEVVSTLKPLEEIIQENVFCLGGKDRGTRRGRHSTSSSSFNEPSSSHLNDDDDGNNEGTSRASTPSLIRYVNSLTNKVP